MTTNNYNGSQALTACAARYHMASLWEILDVTNLTYDYDHPAAFNKADSGYGPPSLWYGWARTGGFSGGANIAGQGNCNVWSSSSVTDYGVAVRLTNTWESPPNEIANWWDATSFSCNTLAPVWCVGEFYNVNLPLIIKP